MFLLGPMHGLITLRHSQKLPVILLLSILLPVVSTGITIAESENGLIKQATHAQEYGGEMKPDDREDLQTQGLSRKLMQGSSITATSPHFTVDLLCALLGGWLIHVISLIKRLGTGRPMETFSSRRSWLLWILLPLPGAILVVAYLLSDVQLSPILALNIGLSGPGIVGRMISSEERRIC